VIQYHQNATEHSVVWTTGIRRVFRQFSTPQQDSVFKRCARPARLPLAQTVETVEKVPFQKLIFEKWEGNTKKRLVFGTPHNVLVRFWLFFSLFWEIFFEHFSNHEFFDSLVRRIAKQL